MSNHMAVATVTGVLRHLLERALADEGGAKVTHVRPDNAAALPNLGVNIFLYQAQQSQALNAENLPLRSRDGELMARPRVALELDYLLTFYGDETKLDPQRLLGRVAATLHGRSVLTRSMVHRTLGLVAFNYLLGSDLENDPELVKLSPLPLSLEEMTKLWSVLLQTKYSLSATYKATAVYVEAAEQVSDALPVAERRLFGAVISPPVVQRVAPLTLHFAPAASLTISGMNLGGDGVRVRFGAEEVEPSLVSDTRVAAVPPRTARAGPTAVTVTKAIGPGSRFSIESEAASFILAPRIVSQTFAAGQVTLNVEPVVGERQQAEIVLLSMPAAAPAEYVLPAAPRTAPATVLTASAAGVPPAAYLVRVRVDGAASRLVVDETPGSPTLGQFIGPTVTVA